MTKLHNVSFVIYFLVKEKVKSVLAMLIDKLVLVAGNVTLFNAFGLVVNVTRYLDDFLNFTSVAKVPYIVSSINVDDYMVFKDRLNNTWEKVKLDAKIPIFKILRPAIPLLTNRLVTYQAIY